MELLVSLTNCSLLAACEVILHAISEAIHQNVDKESRVYNKERFLFISVLYNESENIVYCTKE